MQGCLGGVGVGVDDSNIITALRPGHPAHACGLMELGDRVISIDGVRLAYKGQVWKLAQVTTTPSLSLPLRLRLSLPLSLTLCLPLSLTLCLSLPLSLAPNPDQVMKRSSMHIFGVERRLWEEVNPNPNSNPNRNPNPNPDQVQHRAIGRWWMFIKGWPSSSILKATRLPLPLTRTPTQTPTLAPTPTLTPQP